MKRSRSIRAGVSPARASSRAPSLKTYRVHCLVTRSEWYEIDAPDEETARETAYSDGEFIERGDTIDVERWDIEEVES
jgi:hypothetical protein